MVHLHTIIYGVAAGLGESVTLRGRSSESLRTYASEEVMKTLDAVTSVLMDKDDELGVPHAMKAVS